MGFLKVRVVHEWIEELIQKLMLYFVASTGSVVASL